MDKTRKQKPLRRKVRRKKKPQDTYEISLLPILLVLLIAGSVPAASHYYDYHIKTTSDWEWVDVHSGDGINAIIKRHNPEATTAQFEALKKAVVNEELNGGHHDPYDGFSLKYGKPLYVPILE